MEKIDDQHSRMVIAGRQFRVFESFYWNAAERIARLDEEDIAVQVISPLPELLSYWLAPDAAEAITDFMNGFVADMVRSAPRASQAWAASRQAAPCASSSAPGLGLGRHVGSHVNGVPSPTSASILSSRRRRSTYSCSCMASPGGASVCSVRRSCRR
jgi:aminocarboxymuconate-semialdehyde decarboxylase